MGELTAYQPITLVATVSADPSTNSPALMLNDNSIFSIQMTLSGSDVAGTAKLQASNDGTNWVDVPSSSQSITGSSDYIWNVTGAAYRNVRFSWTYTSGTGNLTVIGLIKDTPISGG